MTISKQEIEKVQENWQKFIGLVEKVSDETVRSGLLALCNDLEDRLAVCPASTKTDYVGAYMGGLVETSLKTVKLMNALNKSYERQVQLELDSIIICGLFAQLGKIGTQQESLYLEKDSQWHNERGIMFDYNSKISNIPVATRSVWWIVSRYGVNLSLDEIYAISSLATIGQIQQNSTETYKAPLLSMLLQHATQVVSTTANPKKNSVLID